MTNAVRLPIVVRIPTIDVSKLGKFEWRNAYEKVSADRLARSAALATNAPKLPPVVASHYVLEGAIADELIGQLPTALVERECPVIIYTVFKSDAPSQLIIHKDWGRLSVINAYEAAGKDVTTFYSHDKELNTVTSLESFCAAAGEVWAMNSKVYHGVIFNHPVKRSMVNFAFRRISLSGITESFS